MEQAIQSFFQFVSYHFGFIENIFRGLYRNDLLIFDVPFWQWVVYIFIGGALISILSGVFED